MASTSGVKGYKSGKPVRRSLISSTNNHSAISQRMKKVEARGVRRSATKERKRAFVVSDEEEDVITLDILPESTHRDGSIYNMGTHMWKRNYHVADRSESKWSISIFLFLFVMTAFFQAIGSTHIFSVEILSPIFLCLLLQVKFLRFC